MVYIVNNVSYYNFYDIALDSWVSASAETLTIGGLIAVDSEGFYYEDTGKLIFAIIKSESGSTSLINVIVATDGSISYLGTDGIIDSEFIQVRGDNDFVSSGYSDVAISQDTISGTFGVLGL